jgi:hypothetical protein
MTILDRRVPALPLTGCVGEGEFSFFTIAYLAGIAIVLASILEMIITLFAAESTQKDSICESFTDIPMNINGFLVLYAQFAE